MDLSVFAWRMKQRKYHLSPEGVNRNRHGGTSGRLRRGQVGILQSAGGRRGGGGRVPRPPRFGGPTPVPPCPVVALVARIRRRQYRRSDRVAAELLV